MLKFGGMFNSLDFMLSSSLVSFNKRMSILSATSLLAMGNCLSPLMLFMLRKVMFMVDLFWICLLVPGGGA